VSRGPDAATTLARALLASAEAAGCPLRIAASDWTRWASATFTGAWHMLTLEGEWCPSLDAWLTALPEAEFALRGHMVADLTVVSVRREEEVATVVVEVLTVEER
jgi:hypothetical protein